MQQSSYIFPSTMWLSFCILVITTILCCSEVIAEELCDLNTEGLLRHYGYDSESHTIQTEDGYILTAFRCNSKTAKVEDKKPILVQHGLFTSSDDFSINPPGVGLAYILADAGYDVWLLNSRGTVYSRKHISNNPNSASSGYWDFTWYEMGIFDQAAVIDYVLNKTGNSQLYYVGHSQGAASLLILLSEKPEYNSKIVAASLMAPAAFLNQDGPNQLWAASAAFSTLIPITEFIPRYNTATELYRVFCGQFFGLCNNLIDFVSGRTENQRNETLMRVILCHQPSGSSVKQVFHFGQSILYGTFGKYSNDATPPMNFPLSKITVPMSLHFSAYDAFIYPAGVDKLIPKLTSVKYLQIINNTIYNHLDFLYGTHSYSLVYSKIVKFLKSYK